MKKNYTFGRFLVELILGLLTGGLWWIWMLFKALREK